MHMQHDSVRSIPHLDEYVIAHVKPRCWLVGCNGKFIAGAVLSSFRAAADYVSAIAEGTGSARFRVRLMETVH